MPEAAFANVMLWNLHLQTLDYNNRQISLNKKQLKYDNDETKEYQILLSPKKPKNIKNWLDTENRLSGSIFYRFLLSEGHVETPIAKVVKLSDYV